jgi:hypothetical protein
MKHYSVFRERRTSLSDICPFVLFQASSIVISVTGMFREPTIMKSPLIRSFCRVFILVQIGPRDFQIANETMHVKNATTEEAEVSKWYDGFIFVTAVFVAVELDVQ